MSLIRWWHNAMLYASYYDAGEWYCMGPDRAALKAYRDRPCEGYGEIIFLALFVLLIFFVHC